MDSADKVALRCMSAGKVQAECIGAGARTNEQDEDAWVTE